MDRRSQDSSSELLGPKQDRTSCCMGCSPPSHQAILRVGSHGTGRSQEHLARHPVRGRCADGELGGSHRAALMVRNPHTHTACVWKSKGTHCLCDPRAPSPETTRGCTPPSGLTAPLFLPPISWLWFLKQTLHGFLSETRAHSWGTDEGARSPERIGHVCPRVSRRLGPAGGSLCE